MNWEHLKTYIWVRWRLSVNQIKRAGTFGAVVAAVLNGLRILGGAIMFLTGLLVGIFALGKVEPRVVMAVWDGVAAAFILFWMIGLLSELQRTELLSLNNFMHLPVSPSGAFLINYVGSSVGLALILFLPAMLGLSAGLTLSRGIGMLTLFPLVVAFFLMITAVTYQFRGWLAGMMTNPRRRRTIVAIVSLAFILVFQLPNILTNFNPAFREKRQARAETRKEISELKKELDAGRITQKEYAAKETAMRTAMASDFARDSGKIFEYLRVVNGVVPPGWLPYGAESAAGGRAIPVAACVFGMALLGAASLRRSYKTTIRLYTGDFGKPRAKRAAKANAAPKAAAGIKAAPVTGAAFLEKRLPRMSEQVSAVTLAGLRSLLRSTEVKMMMLTPVIMSIVFGGMLLGHRGEIPGLLRPLSALGFAAFMLILSMTGFAGNTFAFDRSGFRAYVLSGVARKDILLGKNLAFLPFAALLMALAIAVSEWLNPMRIDHLAAAVIQIFPLYLLFCITANVLSILSPLTLKQGSGMPASHQGVRTLFQLLFMVVVPIPLGCTLLPLGIEALFSAAGWLEGYPVFLTLGILQAVVVWWAYRKVIDAQGILLQKNEIKILEVVCQKGE